MSRTYGAGELTIRVDETNAVLIDPSGMIAERGIHPICPTCKKVYLHGEGLFAGWTVGSQKRKMCKRCQVDFVTLELSVPAEMTAEELYEICKEAVVQRISRRPAT